MFWQSMKEWWMKPFSADMSAPHWFLFIALISVILIGWTMILREITSAVKG